MTTSLYLYPKVGLLCHPSEYQHYQPLWNHSPGKYRLKNPVFGQGGTISFTALNDTPSAITPAGVLIGNSTSTEILAKTPSAGTGINIDNSSDSNITITNTGANINADTSPILGGPLSGNQVYAIGKIATSPEAIAEFNTTHGSAITINDIVTDKKFQDQFYAPNTTFEPTKPVKRSAL